MLFDSRSTSLNDKVVPAELKWGQSPILGRTGPYMSMFVSVIRQVPVIVLEMGGERKIGILTIRGSLPFGL